MIDGWTDRLVHSMLIVSTWTTVDVRTKKKKKEEEGLAAQESRIRGKIDSGITGNYVTVYYWYFY